MLEATAPVVEARRTRWPRVLGALWRVSMLNALQYRGDFWLQAGTGALETAARVAPLLLVFRERQTVSGWTFSEALLVMAFFLLLLAFDEGIMEPNLGAVVESVRQGSLDLVLLKPADAQLLVSASRIDPTKVWDVGAAVLIGGIALSKMGVPTPLDVLVSAALLGAGLAAMYGLWIFAICSSFFFVRVDNLRYLLMSVADTGRWPVSIFATWARVVLTAVIPVALVTSFPAMALRGLWDGRLVAIAVVVAIAFLVGSRWAWKRSLAAYTSASS